MWQEERSHMIGAQLKLYAILDDHDDDDNDGGDDALQVLQIQI